MVKLDDDMNDPIDMTSLTENNFQDIDDLLLELLEDDGDDDSEPSSPTEGEGEGGNIIIQPVALVPRKKKKKKKKSTKRGSTNPAFNPQIRIFRRDIRRRYASMFNNVVNSHDSSLLSQFLKEFAVPQLKALEEIPEDLEIKLYRMKVIQGQDQFVRMLGLNYLMMPDSFFRLTDIKVCQTLNISGSRIILRSEMTGTMLYEVMNSHSRHHHHQQQQHQQQHHHHHHHHHHRTITNGEEMNESQHVYSNELQTTGPTLQILHKPFEYTLDTVLTMQLDENHRITSFILNVLNTKERSIEV